MALRGSKPKPVELKEAAGTLKKSRVIDNAIEFPPIVDPVKPPSWVKGRVARAYWQKLEPMLRTQRVLTEDNLESLGHLCLLHQALVRIWREGGIPGKDKLSEFRILSESFGLTPSSRQRVPRAGGSGQSNRFVKHAARARTG